jgi:hypothetical protein
VRSVTQISGAKIKPTTVTRLSTRDPSHQAKTSEMSTAREYSLRASSQEAEQWHIRCVCGATGEGIGDSETWIACDKCDIWQHNICMGLGSSTEDLPEKYQCEKCAPEAHKTLLESSEQGGRLWEERRKAHEQQLARGEKRSKETKKRKQSHITSSKDAEVPDANTAVPVSFPLTEECHHYTSRAVVPWDIQK